MRLLSLMIAVFVTLAVMAFRHRISGLSQYGYAGILLIGFIGNATVLFPAPSMIATFAGGAVFNPLIVGLAAGVGEALGELTGYLAGYGGRAVIENREMYERLERWMRRNGGATIFILSAIPNPFFDLAGIAAGALRFPLWRFLLSCWMGKTLKSLATAFAGVWGIRLLELFLKGI